MRGNGSRHSTGRRRSRHIHIPYEAIGKYYDELPSQTKTMFWIYFYEGAFTRSQAEALARKTHGSLHFKCVLRDGSIPEGLQDTIAEIDALIAKI